MAKRRRAALASRVCRLRRLVRNLFGTTVAGGANGFGTVFDLAKSGSSYTEGILYSFAGGTADGNGPDYGLIEDTKGNLYGTTSFGGMSNAGTAFELVKSGSTYTETILHNFTGGAADGSNPVGGLIADASGNLFGNTLGGSTGGNGTVFELVKSGSNITPRLSFIPSPATFPARSFPAAEPTHRPE